MEDILQILILGLGFGGACYLITRLLLLLLEHTPESFFLGIMAGALLTGFAILLFIYTEHPFIFKLLKN